MPEPLPPPPSCPIDWQPHALAPVFYGRRELSPDNGAPVKAALCFPSLDGAVMTAPLLEGCARYPLVLLVHGHCRGDRETFKRWFYLADQLARCGYVVVMPQLGGISAGQHPSNLDHPDLAKLATLVSWMRSDWEYADVLDEGPIGVVGHSFGALLGGRFATTANVGAFVSLSGVWGDWPNGPVLNPLTQMSTATLFVWGTGDPLDVSAVVSERQWNDLPPPKHRAIWAQGEHWDYFPHSNLPCSRGRGPCAVLGAATADLVTLFLGKYLPPELAIHLIEEIPDDLTTPDLTLTPEQQFFAGGHLSSFARLEGLAECTLSQRADPWPLLANRRSKETHSRIAPCAWVRLIAPSNRRLVHKRPVGYFWCDFCFPEMADG